MIRKAPNPRCFLVYNPEDDPRMRSKVTERHCAIEKPVKAKRSKTATDPSPAANSRENVLCRMRARAVDHGREPKTIARSGANHDISQSSARVTGSRKREKCRLGANGHTQNVDQHAYDMVGNCSSWARRTSSILGGWNDCRRVRKCLLTLSLEKYIPRPNGVLHHIGE